MFETLKKDHREASSLMDRIVMEPDAGKRQQEFAELKRELDLHTDVEEQAFYPELEKRAPALHEVLMRAHEEHERVKQLLRDIEALPASNPEWLTKLRAVKQDVSRHIQLEEGEIFPRAQSLLVAEQLDDIARTVEETHKSRLEHWKVQIKGAAEKAADTAKKAMH